MELDLTGGQPHGYVRRVNLEQANDRTGDGDGAAGEEEVMNTAAATPAAAGETTVNLAGPAAQREHHAEGSDGQRQHGARAVLAAPGAWPLLSTSIIARLPLAMLSLVLLVHTERVTGSFALAGLVTGSYTVGLGVGAPVL